MLQCATLSEWSLKAEANSEALAQQSMTQPIERAVPVCGSLAL